MPIACLLLRIVYSSWEREGWFWARADRNDGDSKTYLPSGVDDVTVIVDALVVDSLVEDVLDGRVVGLDEVVLDELNNERGLPWERGAPGRRGGADREQRWSGVQGAWDSPTEREPRTAIFLLLRMSPGMVGKGRVGGGAREEEGEKRRWRAEEL